MHAGLARARGARIVTMDGDLQNEPEDIPKLLDALDRVDVASGRRVARRDSPGRTLPSRVINGLLRRFTGVSISDFGCAFNGYRREAIEPMLGAIGRQKFTKALVLSSRRLGRGSRRVARAPRAPARATRRSASSGSRCTSSPASGRSRCSGSASRSGSSASLAAAALGIYGVVYWIVEQQLPRAALRRSRHCSRPRHPGIRPRADRRVARPDPAGRRRQAAVHDRGGALSKRVLVTGGAGFISSNFIRHLLEATPTRGRDARRAHVRRATSRTSPT